MTNDDETVLIPGAGPIAWSAARTVSAVVRTAPPTDASHSPHATSSEPKYSGSASAASVCSLVHPLGARRA